MKEHGYRTGDQNSVFGTLELVKNSTSPLAAGLALCLFYGGQKANDGVFHKIKKKRSRFWMLTKHTLPSWDIFHPYWFILLNLQFKKVKS